ncbi:hypothetical protein DdX_04061 [Ditylenchus destructor]|uniref:Uncharacterized protein n=1 Tax=Ditylenchus destructor TaxID=166010 RepID=A0AAD4NBG7_9BILA|nr:hypothetical protein DdX_04061 [Ditylenchus destructor]
MSPFCVLTDQDSSVCQHSKFDKKHLNKCMEKLTMAENCLQHFMDFEWDDMSSSRQMKMKALRLKSNLAKVREKLEEHCSLATAIENMENSAQTPIIAQEKADPRLIRDFLSTINTPPRTAKNESQENPCLKKSNFEESSAMLSDYSRETAKLSCEVNVRVVPITAENRHNFSH